MSDNNDHARYSHDAMLRVIIWYIKSADYRICIQDIRKKGGIKVKESREQGDVQPNFAHKSLPFHVRVCQERITKANGGANKGFSAVSAYR